MPRLLLREGRLKAWQGWGRLVCAVEGRWKVGEWFGESGRGCWVVKCAFSAAFTPFSRALYTHFISRKKHSPLHRLLVFLWFSLENGVKGWKSNPSHLFRCRWLCDGTVVNARWMLGEHLVNAWKSKPSHSFLLSIKEKRAVCEGLNLFFGEKVAYTRARKGSRKL